MMTTNYKKSGKGSGLGTALGAGVLGYALGGGFNRPQQPTVIYRNAPQPQPHYEPPRARARAQPINPLWAEYLKNKRKINSGKLSLEKKTELIEENQVILQTLNSGASVGNAFIDQHQAELDRHYRNIEASLKKTGLTPKRRVHLEALKDRIEQFIL